MIVFGVSVTLLIVALIRTVIHLGSVLVGLEPWSHRLAM